MEGPKEGLDAISELDVPVAPEDLEEEGLWAYQVEVPQEQPDQDVVGNLAKTNYLGKSFEKTTL